MIQLYDYVYSFDLLKDINQDLRIISDITPPESLPKHIEYVSLQDIIQSPEKYTSSSVPTIAISEKLTSKDMLRLQALTKSSYTRISLDPGLRSVLTKNNPESNDIVSFLKERYEVINPYTTQDISRAILSPTLRYLRISNTPLPEELSHYITEEWFAYKKNQNDVPTPPDYTVITDPSTLDKLARAQHTLASQAIATMDVFVHYRYPTQLPQPLIDSLEHTQHLIIILDHHATQELWLYYDTLIKQHNKLQHINIQFIFPQFHLLSSMLEDYIEEEALFDQQHIVDFFSDHPK